MAKELQDKIEEYLLSKMNEEDEQLFEEQLRQDPNLKEEVELTALIIGSARKIGLKTERDSVTADNKADWEILKSASSDEVESLTKGKSRTKIVPWLTGSVAAVVLLFIVIHFNNQASSTDKLYASYYKPFEEEPILHRGADVMDEGTTELLDDALQHYANHQYNSALDLLNKVAPEYADQIVVYKSICLLETKQPKQAAQVLSSALVEYGEGWEYYQDAQWYLSLAYLKSKQKEEAMAVLEQIVKAERVYAEQAGKLLEGL